MHTAVCIARGQFKVFGAVVVLVSVLVVNVFAGKKAASDNSLHDHTMLKAAISSASASGPNANVSVGVNGATTRPLRIVGARALTTPRVIGLPPSEGPRASHRAVTSWSLMFRPPSAEMLATMEAITLVDHTDNITLATIRVSALPLDNDPSAP